VEIKYLLDATDDFFIADLIACSTCIGHHYAHHQELKSIIQVVAACSIWCFGFQVVGLVWSCGLCVRFAGCCSILQTGHTTIMPIIRSSRVLYRWLLPVVFGALVFKLSVLCGAVGCVRFAGCNLKTKTPNTTGSNHCIILLNS